MARATRCTVAIGHLLWTGPLLAQDTGIGLRDARSPVEQQNAIARMGRTANDLFDVGAEHGGIASAAKPFAEAAGKDAETVLDLTAHAAGQAFNEPASSVTNALIDSVQVNADANRNPNNDAQNDAARFVQQRVCEFNPAACARPVSDSPEITDKNVRVVCNPLTASLTQVANDKDLVYRNECNWGIADRSVPSGYRGTKTSILLCKGWKNITVLQTVDGIPTNARGYQGTTTAIDPTTGRPDNYSIYNGTRFTTPCRPPANASNPLQGGCFDPGFLFKLGNCR